MNAKSLQITALLFLCFPAASISQDNYSSFIDVVKDLRAVTLSKELPDIAFYLWLEQAFEHGEKVEWEANDCGEGGDGRTAPLCVEAIIPQQKGYRLHISIGVADRAGQKISKPQIYMLYFHKLEGYKTLDSVRVKTIQDAIRLYKTDLDARTK